MRYLAFLLPLLLTGCFDDPDRVQQYEVMYNAGDRVQVTSRGFYEGCIANVVRYYPFKRKNMQVEYELDNVKCKGIAIKSGLRGEQNELRKIK